MNISPERNEQISRISAAQIAYTKLNTDFSEEAMNRWLENVGETFQDYFREMTRDERLRHLDFHVYTLEKAGVSQKEYLKTHLSEEDYKLWWEGIGYALEEQEETDVED